MAKQTGSIDLKAAKNAHDEAEKVATNYVMTHTDNASYFHAEDNNFDPSAGNAVKITDQIDIVRDGESAMAIGETNTETGNDVVRIGKSGETRAEIDYHSLQLIDKEGYTYFFVSDLRNQQGYAEITEVFTGDGREKSFSVAFTVSQEVSATDSSNPSNTTTRSGRTYTFAVAPEDLATITITYQTTQPLKAFTLGSRDQNELVGANSVAEGRKVVASGAISHAEGDYTEAEGYCSHAEGLYATARGNVSHAEGCMTTALGDYSHVEGYVTSAGEYAHAEGRNTSATETCSHAEGDHSQAHGLCSHAQNCYTKANYNYQTAIGKYNKNKSADAFEIGNGTSDSARSNAFTVDWQGNVVASGDVTDGSGNVLSDKANVSDVYTKGQTDTLLADYVLKATPYFDLDTTATSGSDKAIYDALAALGWDSDVIV